jgi:tetratricopeptide (TPR) repeat protein
MPMSPEAEERALAALGKAVDRRAGASRMERDYIDALSRRYGTPVGENRAARDSAYAESMRALVKKYPRDTNTAVLCAEALMNLHPWDLWDVGGEPKPWTPEIVARLEATLKASPNHIGAIHLYIHTVEASNDPGRAEAPADRLRKLNPEAGHLMHMPTHIYLRLGRYAEGAHENQRAIEVDRAYIDRWKVEGVYPMMYANHNIHMRLSALCSLGRSAEAIETGRLLAAAVPAPMLREMQPLELFSGAAYLALPRFGRWTEILALPAPPSDLKLTNAAWRFSRGLALAATGRDEEAGVERDSLAAIAAASEGLYFGLAGGPSITNFALTFLDGERAARAGRTEEGIALLARAAALQDSIPYDEPPQWTMSARQSLGAVLLHEGRAADAEAVYRKDLERLPNTGWSLRGLTDALRAQGKTEEAAEAEARFKKAWAGADVAITSSRF